MKLKCTSGKNSNGSLRKGKIYKAFAIPMRYHALNGSADYVPDCININNICFLIFDDKREWNLYPKNLFKPTDE